MKIKVRSFPAILLILSYTRLYINSFYGVYMAYRILILCGLLLYCIKSINKINYSTRIAFFLFMLIAVGSTAVNEGGAVKIAQCMVFFLTILCTYLVATWYKSRNEEHLFVKSVFYTLLILCSICDIVALGERGADYYLLGTKFMVSYIHLMIVFLWQALYRMKPIRKNKYKTVLVVLLIESLFMFFWVGCTTAILLFPLTIFALFCTNKIRKLLQNRNILMIVFAVGNFLVLGMGILANNEKVQYFIMQVLGKGASYKGRLIIYEKITRIIERKPWFGYGYMSDIVNQVVTFGNAQNGLLDMIVQYGIVGIICWGIFVYCSCRSMNDDRYWPISIFVYSLIFASYIEIPFNLFFYLALAILSVFGKYDTKDSERFVFGRYKRR